MGGYKTVVVGADGSDSSMRGRPSGPARVGPGFEGHRSRLLTCRRGGHSLDRRSGDEGYKVTAVLRSHEVCATRVTVATATGAANVEERAIVGCSVDALVDHCRGRANLPPSSAICPSSTADVCLIGAPLTWPVALRRRAHRPHDRLGRTTSSRDAVQTWFWVDGVLEIADFPIAEVSDRLSRERGLGLGRHAIPTTMVSRLADELGFDQHAVEDVVEHGERTKATRYATTRFHRLRDCARPQADNDPPPGCLTARVSIFVPTTEAQANCHNPTRIGFGAAGIDIGGGGAPVGRQLDLLQDSAAPHCCMVCSMSSSTDSSTPFSNSTTPSRRLRMTFQRPCADARHSAQHVPAS